METFQKTDEQFIKRWYDYKMLAYLAISLFAFDSLIQVLSLGIFYKFYKNSKKD